MIRSARAQLRNPSALARACFAAAALLVAHSFAPCSAQITAPPAPRQAAERATLAPDPSLPFLAITPDAWPARAGDSADRKGVIVPLSLDFGSWRGRRIAFDRREPDAADQADAAALALSSTPGQALPRFLPERPGAFVIEFDAPRPGAKGQIAKSQRPAMVFKFASAEQDSAPSAPENTLILQRTFFAFYEPSAGVPVRGVALLMPGLFGTPETIIDHITIRLRQRGWAVLRMLTQPSRFTEHNDITPALDTPPESIAAEISGLLSNRAAECAYAVQAAFNHILTERPELSALPRVALGGSGGGFTIPVVVAREPDKYAALVMIAAGADYFLMLDQSNYASWIRAVRVRWPAGTPSDRKLAIDRAYLDRSPLDAFHAAAALKGKPVLLLHAQADLAVPAALGDVLWERLGRPERWSRPVGHEVMFMGLPSELPAILDWLQAKTQTPEPEPQG